ncbi:MAG: hypothetical protein EA370_13985 [Wenzhouxiangella sp.]|nr:MAG: hypothetical protein EA370_13985 [Wenzhouxiangella sp.]
MNKAPALIVFLIGLFSLAACSSGSDSDPVPSEERGSDHVMQTHQRALESAREMEAEMRERVDQLEQAIERAIEEGEPSRPDPDQDPGQG